MLEIVFKCYSECGFVCLSFELNLKIIPGGGESVEGHSFKEFNPVCWDDKVVIIP